MVTATPLATEIEDRRSRGLVANLMGAPSRLNITALVANQSVNKEAAVLSIPSRLN